MQGYCVFGNPRYHTRMIECPTEDALPFDKASPYMEVREKALAACNTAFLLESEGYDGVEESAAELRPRVHKELARFAENRESALADVATTPAGAIYVQSILSQYDQQAVKSAQQLRQYITNKLVIETENLDPRVRIRALELLGKITDVGLFTERSEVTVHQKTTQELSETLKDKLRRLIETRSAEDAVVIRQPVQDIKPVDVGSALEGLSDIESA